MPTIVGVSSAGQGVENVQKMDIKSTSLIVICLLSAMGCGTPEPVGIPQDRQDVNGYKFAMAQEFSKGTVIIAEYSTFIDTWNSQLLNPQWTYLKGLLTPIRNTSDAHLQTVKQISTKSSEITAAHNLYVGGWTDLMESINSMNRYLDTQGADANDLLIANQKRDSAAGLFERFNNAYRDL